MPTVDSDIIDEIYEAGLVPDRWPLALSRICQATDTWAGGLIALDQRHGLRGVSTETYRRTYEGFLVSGGRYENMRAQRSMVRNHAGFLRDIDLCSPEELEVDPIYRDFLRPHGLGWTVGTFVPVPTADLLIFDFAGRIADGPQDEKVVQQLDLYRPHLARAALLSARLGLERVRSMASALDLLGLPAAVMGIQGRTIATNDAFEKVGARVEPSLLRAEFGGMTMSNATRGSDSAIRSYPLPATLDQPALVVHRIPIRRSALDVFTGAAWIILVTPVEAPGVPSTALLTGLFDLSPAEARVARAIAAGRTIDDCASDFGLSVETIRSQVKSAMAKTGTRRQVDLVRILLGVGAAIPGSD